MNDFQIGILALMKSAITGEKIQLPADFSLENSEAFIKQQQITSLVYTGIINCGMSVSPDLGKQLFKHHCHCLFYGEQQMQACEAVFRAFDEAGIDYLPLKGCNMKALYPKQELRWMSDADILIRTEQYERIKPIMLNLGYIEETESDHEFIWNSRKLHIELHKRLIPSYNKDYYTYFGDGWRLAKPVSGSRHALSAEDAFIFQFVHFAKHYRDGGIGCRYVLDLWVYRRSNPSMNEQYVQTELKKMQLINFYQNILQLIDNWFESAPSTEQTRFITDFIFKGGSWGNWKDHALSRQVRKTTPDTKPHVSKLDRAIEMAFPNAESISHRYPILKKHPVLLPVIWPIRWVQVLLFRRQNLRIKQRELSYITTERVSEYQDALHYVGLDFNFDQESSR